MKIAKWLFLGFFLTGCSLGHTLHPAENLSLTPNVRFDKDSAINGNNLHINNIAVKAKYKF